MAHTRTGAVQLFPRPKVERPSNNVQPVFSRPNPFLTRAQAGPLTRTRQEVRRTAGGARQDIVPTITDALGKPIPLETQAFNALQEGRPVEAQQSLRRAAGLPAEEKLDVLEGSLAAVAKELAPAVASNPFISNEAKQALSEGRLPLLGDISAAFYRHTSPTVVQILQGLFTSSGFLRQEDLDAAANIRPASFR